MSQYYRWVRRTLRSDIRIAGRAISTGGAEMSWREAADSSALMRMLAGNTVYQRRIGERFAPMMLAPWLDVELRMLGIDEGDYDFLAEVQGQDVPVFVELAHTDRYFLTAETHTEWVLSRALPWVFGADTDYPVTVKVSNADDRETFDELTLAAGSPPGAGEFYYTGAAGEQSIETDDLAGEAGRILTVTYSPIRRMVVQEVESSTAGEDRHAAIDVSVRMSEHLPSQLW